MSNERKEALEDKQPEGQARSIATAADADENVAELVASLDAVLDQASELAQQAGENLSPEAAQALDLITAAESISDSLMELLSISDPDDMDAEPDDMAMAKAAAIKTARAAAPKPLSGRMVGFPTKLSCRQVDRNGKAFFEVNGQATTYNQPYTMYDMFGEYTEEVDRSALTESLARKPDVAFLVNHRGVTMARTANETLEIKNSNSGLDIHALLNAGREDVKLLMSAIDDELIDQMSFAFMLEEGEWNEDYDHFTIKKADIDRGDVSAVNYGANPYTSIAARSKEWMEQLKEMPASVQRAAVVQIRASLSGVRTALQAREVVDPTPQPEPVVGGLPEPQEIPEPSEPLARSRAMYMNKLMLETEELEDIFKER